MTFTMQSSYKDLSRKLFLGSPYKELDFSKVNYSWIYLTNYFPYACIYARKDNDNFGYVHQFNIKRPLKIFNARCASDIQFLKENFSGYSEELITQLQTEDWIDVFSNIRYKDEFIQGILIKEGKYDGFFGYEVINEPVLSPYMNKIQPSLGLFNADDLCYHIVYEQREFTQFKDYSDIRNAEYRAAKEMITQELENGKNIDDAIDDVFDRLRMLSKDEVLNAYNITILEEWMKNRYKITEERNYWELDAGRVGPTRKK